MSHAKSMKADGRQAPEKSTVRADDTDRGASREVSCWWCPIDPEIPQTYADAGLVVFEGKCSGCGADIRIVSTVEGYHGGGGQ